MDSCKIYLTIYIYIYIVMRSPGDEVDPADFWKEWRDIEKAKMQKQGSKFKASKYKKSVK